VIAGAVMLASGALCLGGAVVSRSRVGIVAAAIMALAMAELVLLGIVPPLVWAALLLVAGVALGLRLRLGPETDESARRDPLPRAVMIASALAYPAMAWLVLAHDHGLGAPAALGAHAGHGSGLLPILVLAPLIAALLALGGAAAFRRRPLLAVEAIAMAAMLLAMLA